MTVAQQQCYATFGSGQTEAFVQNSCAWTRSAQGIRDEEDYRGTVRIPERSIADWDQEKLKARPIASGITKCLPPCPPRAKRVGFTLDCIEQKLRFPATFCVETNRGGCNPSRSARSAVALLLMNTVFPLASSTRIGRARKR